MDKYWIYRNFYRIFTASCTDKQILLLLTNPSWNARNMKMQTHSWRWKKLSISVSVNQTRVQPERNSREAGPEDSRQDALTPQLTSDTDLVVK